ncbi:kinetochore protein SPC25, putative [Plasmodium malariae]|uniref:Kinetochore protein SPC25 n=1 Tax=Plasmodium malariae TaxID=5858 RepID=A0A1C3L0D3_PLAMA|nr:kinetochore protein SPC25, putative [Plasmodium malariae]
MEDVLDNNKIKESLQQQINQIVEDNEKQYNELISYIENEKKQIEILKNKTKEKKISINRITHEIEANTVLVTELKESVMEEEKKLDEYPKLIDEINERLNLILKNFDSSKLEYNTVKLHKDYIESEWKKKLETLYNLLGFEIILQDDKIVIEFYNIQMSDPQKKYRATVTLHNGTYEAIETTPRLNKFEDYVNSLNKGMPFTTFCCLLRKSFKELK